MKNKHIIDELPNGLRTVIRPLTERNSVSLGIWMGVGGRYETEPEKGAAHFLEHIVFKGSQKYTDRQIKELIEGVGGTLNAFTSEEHTCFFAKIPARWLERTFDILADMTIAPFMAGKDIKKEKTVVLEEIKMYRDLPQYLVMDALGELLWPDHPLGQNLAGTIESVSSFDSPKIKDFFGRFYNPNNCVISVSGNCSTEKIQSLVRKRFKGLKRKDVPSYMPSINAQTGPKVRFLNKTTEQIHMALGMFGYDDFHKDRYSLLLLAIILGGNMSSRLFTEIREKRGMAYSISAASKSLYDTGMFVVRAGVENAKVENAVALILKELQKISARSVTDDEFRRAREYVLGQLRLNLEDTMEDMLWMGESLMTKNKVRTLDEIVKDFNSVSPLDLKRVAKDVFDESRFNLAIVGQLTGSQQTSLTSLIKG
jgi:predicted Zn-dependent peptidase